MCFTEWFTLRMFALIAICAGVSRCQSYQSGLDEVLTTERSHNSVVCMNIYPQRAMDMEQIMGKWYGNEIIIHTQDVPGVFQYDSCVVIQIEDVTDQMQNHFFNGYGRTTVPQQHESTNRQQRQHRQGAPDLDIGFRRQPAKYLRLLWAERDDTLEYIFNYTTDSPGRWTNVGEQRGSFVTLNHYTQFSGTVQVAKAVNDHLVLTFCGNDLKSTIYTIVLSRQPQGLNAQELYSIRTLLSNRLLSVDSIRKICSSAAMSVSMPFNTPIGTMLLLVVAAAILRQN